MEEVVVHSRELRHEEGIFLYQLLVKRMVDHPLARYARSLPYEHIDELMRVMVHRYEIKFSDTATDLQTFKLLYAREQLYQKLLDMGAPLAMLHRCFVKSHRQIIIDRQVWGNPDAVRGRPRAIGAELSYEISGLWDEMQLEEPDFARRFALLNERYPRVSAASLYALLGGRDAD